MRSPTRFWAVALLLASGLAACTDSTGPTSPQVIISVDDPVAAQRGNGADGEVIRLPLDITIENIGSVGVWYRSSTGQRPSLYKHDENYGMSPVERQVPAELVHIRPGEQHTTRMELGYPVEEWEGVVTDDNYRLAVQLLDEEEHEPVQWPEGLSEAFSIELIEP